MPSLLLITLLLFILLFLKYYKIRKYLILTYIFLFFINIWIPLFIYLQSGDDLYLGNSFFYESILIWLAAILFLIYLNPFRYIYISSNGFFKRKLTIIRFSDNLILFIYFIVFLILLIIGTSNVYLIAFISSIAALLYVKNTKYFFLFLIIVTLLTASFQRSLVFPFLFLFYLKLYKKEINIKQLILFSFCFLIIFYVALVGRGLVKSVNYTQILENLIISKENISILTSNMSNVNIGSVVFEMKNSLPPSIYDIFEYLINILLPIPSSISNFDFQKFYVSRYLGTEPSLGLPMPACYQFYYFFGNWSVIYLYIIFFYLSKIDKELNLQFSENKTNIFSFITLFTCTLNLLYFHHSDFRFFMVSTIFAISCFNISKYLNIYHVLR